MTVISPSGEIRILSRPRGPWCYSQNLYLPTAPEGSSKHVPKMSWQSLQRSSQQRYVIWRHRYRVVSSSSLGFTFVNIWSRFGCSEETYSRTTMNGRPCSSLTTEAVFFWFSIVPHQMRFNPSTNESLPCDKSSSEDSQSVNFRNEGYCGHTHSHFDGGLRKADSWTATERWMWIRSEDKLKYQMYRD